MTNREAEFVKLGWEYCEGIEQSTKIQVPQTGRYIYREGTKWITQPWNDNVWNVYSSLLEAAAAATPPSARPVKAVTDPQPYLVLHEGEAELCRGFCPCDNRTIEVYATGSEYLIHVCVACDRCKKPVECYPWTASALTAVGQNDPRGAT